MKRRDFFQADDQAGAAPLRRAEETLVAAIVEEAKRRGIELTRDPDLLAALASVESEDQIPREMYAAMAVVLSWMDGLATHPADSTQKT
ncbi:MAG: EscU/YscU/HrcU family type III secretion system export apparatus switch protein [Oxalobacteraceae bacterium]